VKALLIAGLVVALTAAPAAAQTADPASAFTYYVGTWSCLGGPTETPAVKATITASINDGLLTEHVSVPVQTGMEMALSQLFTVAYSPFSKGYNEIEIDNFGGWRAAKASPWTGNTEDWTDVASADGKLGRVQVVRTDQNHFTSTGYATPTDTAPNFKATCQRQ
jgi:hypothetical protein